MKKIGITLSIIMTITLLSCTTYVTVSEDPYIKATIVKYEKWHKVLEGDLTNQRACYTRHIRGADRGPITVELEFYGMVLPMFGYTGDGLDEQAYVLINSISFPIKLADRKNNKNVIIHGSINGSDQMSGFSYGSRERLSIGASTTCRLSARFTMSPEMERALAVAEKMSIRVSAGGKPTILKVSGGQIDMLKELAAFTPGQK